MPDPSNTSEVEALVAKLRDLHRGVAPRSSGDTRGESTDLADGARSGGSTASPIPSIVEHLGEIHLKRAGRSRRRPRTTPKLVNASEYDEVRALFREREQSLRRQEQLVDRILDQLRSGEDVRELSEPVPLQQSLRLVCPVGGATAGRFVVENGSSEPAHVHFEVQPLRGAPTGFARSAAVEFEPGALHLRKGQASVVSVEIDSREIPLRGGDRLELPVVMRADTGILGRLWIELVLVDADALAHEAEESFDE
jgi:hypothetical protein